MELELVSGLHRVLPIHSLSLGGSRAGPEMQILVKCIQKQQGSMCCAAETHHVPGWEFSSQHSTAQEGFSSLCRLWLAIFEG